MSLFGKPRPRQSPAAIRKAKRLARLAKRKGRQDAIKARNAKRNAAKQRAQKTRAHRRGTRTGLTADQRKQLKARAAAADAKGFWG